MKEGTRELASGAETSQAVEVLPRGHREGVATGGFGDPTTPGSLLLFGPPARGRGHRKRAWVSSALRPGPPGGVTGTSWHAETLAAREPRLLLRADGAFLLRLEDRALIAVLFQLPPRLTRALRPVPLGVASAEPAAT